MKRILLTVLISLALIVPCFAEQLTPEQVSEDITLLNIVKEVDKQIPIDTIVTSETIETIGNQIERIITKAGYSEEEYYMRTIFCPVGHIHYKVVIQAKTQTGEYTLEAIYFFEKPSAKPIGPGIDT